MRTPTATLVSTAVLGLFGAAPAAAQLGTNYCTANPNSTGSPSHFAASGSPNLLDDNFHIACSGLPPGSFGYVIASRDRGFVANPAGSQGNLCLSGAIRRLAPPVLLADPSGHVSRVIPAATLRAAAGPILPQLGPFELHFQYWHRDSAPGGAPTSNFSDGLSVSFYEQCPLTSSGFPDARYDTGIGGPGALVSGDLDGDGRRDLVTTLEFADAVAVLRRLPDGRFGAPMSVQVGDDPRALAVGDLDGDGDLDLAVANYAGGTVSVLRNAGDGTFGSRVDHAAGPALRGVALGDVDGDGALDVVVCNSGWQQDTVRVLRNLGGGTFGTPVALALPNGSSPASAALADLDGDGDVDLVTGNPDNGTIALFLNQGAGTFAPPVLAGATSRPSAIVARDFDGDGDVDLAVGGETGLDIAVLWNQGAGAFAPRVLVPADANPAALEAADLDLDGDLDLVVASASTPSARVLLGSSGAWITGQVLQVRSGLRGVAVVGEALAPELAFSLLFSSRVAVFTSDGAGTFDQRERLEAGGGAEALAGGDIDGDGREDLVTANYVADSISVLLGSSGGGFAPQVLYPVGDSPISVALGDVEGDGDLDVAVANYNSNTVSVLRSSAGGTLGNRSDLAAGLRPQRVVWSDLDGDGDQDLLATGDAASGATSELSVFRNQGGGSFAARQVVPLAARATALAVRDVDGDGDADVVLTLGPSSSLALLENVGQGTLIAAGTIPTELRPRDLDLADVDLDGRLDVVVCGEFAVGVHMNLGGLTFAASTELGPANAFLSAVRVADVDGDGRPDVVAALWSIDAVRVWPSRQQGGFESPLEFGTGSAPEELVLRDLNGDGTVEIAVVCRGDSQVSVLTSRCP